MLTTVSIILAAASLVLLSVPSAAPASPPQPMLIPRSVFFGFMHRNNRALLVVPTEHYGNFICGAANLPLY